MAGGGGKPFGDNVFAGHAAAGAAAISASAVAVHPLDTVKSLLQLSAAGQKQKMRLRHAVDRLMHVSGPAGFYSGIGWSILGKLPGLGARFGTYELLTAFYKDGREDNHVYYSEAMLAGSGKPPLPSDVQVPSRVIALEGWGALWRGLRPGIARDCVFSGMFFSCWQFIHTAMLTWRSVNMNPEPRNLEEAGPVPPLASSLAAGFSGVVAAAASHTFDTAKSRSQCTVIPKYIAMERRFLKWRAPEMWIERMTGTSPADRNVLFRGIGLRMARSGIASFVLVGSYYLAVDQLL